MIVHKSAEGISQRALQQFLLRARRAALLAGEVNVMLTSDRRMRALNRRFRGKDKPTDVLSFPSLPDIADEFAGDIAISAELAARNASRFGHTPMHEMKVLVLHGVLHLAGYDHEQDNGEMARKENRLRRELNLQDGLIARARIDATPPLRPARNASASPARASRAAGRRRKPAGIAKKGRSRTASSSRQSTPRRSVR